MSNHAGDPQGEEVDGELATHTLSDFEASVADLAPPKYIFHLYVAGNGSRSRQAVANVRKLCESYLAGHYELDVVDVYQQPETAKSADVIALPTLIKELPLPLRKFVGDMSDTERIIVGLRLRS